MRVHPEYARLRFNLLCVVAFSAFACLSLPSFVSAQSSCDPATALYHVTLPVGSPPTVFSFGSFAVSPPSTFVFTTVYTDEPWATVVSFSNAINVSLNAGSLSPGSYCVNVQGGYIFTLPKDPNNGSPCSSSFNQAGWFNLKTTIPLSGPCEDKVTPDGDASLYPALFGQIAVNVTTAPSVSLIDPIPSPPAQSLIIGGQLATSAQLQGLLGAGVAVRGIAADGAAQIVVRIDTNTQGHQFTVTLVDDQGNSGASTIASEDGALGFPGMPPSQRDR